ncbi:MAG: 6-bladed beta-propeller [Dysgonamonadaceae bacterium]|jgi:hypothetical protein|nr:6-bladed beta-propeller [Dysgonamonadaceae bacterium]
MKAINSLLLLTVCFFYACQKDKLVVCENVDFHVKSIQWKLSRDFHLNNRIKNIQYIRLETSENSLFSNIDKLIIRDNRVYILDITGPKSLLVFDINGKFLHRTGRQGGGPGEYVKYINFDVLDGYVYLYDNSRRNMLIYNPNGKYVKSIKSSFSFFDFMILPDNKFLLALDIYEKNNKNNRIIITEDLKKAEISLLAFGKDFNGNKMNVRSFHLYRDKIAYMSPVMDSLFILSKEGHIERAYYFDFGKHKVPEDLKNNYEELSQARKERDYAYIYNTPILVKNYVFADMFIGNAKGLAVFDTETGQSTYELIKPDNFDIKKVNFPLFAMNDSVIVSYIDENIYGVIKDKVSFDLETTLHLSEGGVVLCLYEIE